MRNLLIFLLATFSLSANCQTVFSTLKHDFGELGGNDFRFVDIQVQNKGNQEVLIFSVRKSSEIDYLISKKRIETDSIAVIRFQVNPKKKGPFVYRIEVFTSDKNEASVITLKGNLQEVPQDKAYLFASCPTFREQPNNTSNEQVQNLTIFPLTVITVDAKSKEKLSESTITLIQGGEAIWAKQTNQDGLVKEDDAHLGLSYFYATHDGYFPGELGTYINFKRNSVVIELVKDSSYSENKTPIFQPLLAEEDAAKNKRTLDESEDREAQETIVSDVVKKQLIDPKPIDEIAVPTYESLAPDNFSSDYFNPVNVVFILDISSSMKQADKLELMKYTLVQLTEMLRPQDQFSMITYASQVNVQIQGAAGDSKDLIKNKIKDLTAGGFTSGGTGIKIGFKTALKTKIANGSNHVIVITDGAFNKESKDYKRQIKKHLKKGITLSIVGVKNNEKDEVEMRSISTLGGGRYVPIMKLSDAQQNLKQEIRMVSFKY